MNLPDELAYLLRKVPALSRAYLVGGCVRNAGHRPPGKTFITVDFIGASGRT